MQNKRKSLWGRWLAAVHFMYADAIIHVHLSLLFNCFISHGDYLEIYDY